jgi:xanthine dehydrogenase accessory factor
MTEQPTDFLASNTMLTDDALSKQVADWQQAGCRTAVAFFLRTWVSSRRQAGNIMLIRDDMQVAESVSGGCVQGVAIDAALKSIKN